jgi:hypothetical protein
MGPMDLVQVRILQLLLLVAQVVAVDRVVVKAAQAATRQTVLRELQQELRAEQPVVTMRQLLVVAAVVVVTTLHLLVQQELVWVPAVAVVLTGQMILDLQTSQHQLAGQVAVVAEQPQAQLEVVAAVLVVESFVFQPVVTSPSQEWSLQKVEMVEMVRAHRVAAAVRAAGFGLRHLDLF